MESTGPEETQTERYISMREANYLFVDTMRVAHGQRPSAHAIVLEPMLRQRADHSLPTVDNGPNRERFADTSEIIAKRESDDAVAVTVARDAEHTAQHYEHSPHLRPRPRIGAFTLFDLTNKSCRYPTGEDGEHIFCGAEIWQGSYCACHYTLTRKRRGGNA